MLYLNVVQTIFVILTPIVVLSCVTLFVIYPLWKRRNVIKFKEYYYKKIFSLVMDKDYYLINNFVFKITSDEEKKIDHLIFADKFIYVIQDFHIDGHLTGDPNDSNVILNKPDGNKSYYPNPLVEVKSSVEDISNFSSLDPDIFIGIALVNNEYNIGIKNRSNKYYIIQRNRLDKLIDAIESRDIKKLDEEALHQAVLTLSKLNIKK